ncbi:NYN domain-containing protein [Alkalihalobacillus oceani]|uniref:NYN domain-containing protein n=1 Tax=Halalkalibacter oceani TaxID=1653776 RepID=UPI002040811E|nr:NYN domain-containing protein [Halalkalibacter oceani]MCM3761063.1 NYN domain-containing protein [Halalkalibacter oceani]
MKRVMVFIDGNNFEAAVNNLYGSQTRLDYRKLGEYIAQEKLGGSLQRLYYYTAKSSKDKDKAQATDRFADYLNKNISKCIAKVGFLMYMGKNENGHDIFSEKGTDVNIAVDLVSLAFQNAYDEAVLLSADTDYEPAINVVRNYGKNVILGLVDKQKGGYLKGICDDHFVFQKEDLDKVQR